MKPVNGLKKQDAAIYEEAKENLHRWFQRWIVLRLLTLEN